MRFSHMHRRDFLRRSLFAGAALAASAAVPLFPVRLLAAEPEGLVQETRLLMGTIVTISAAASAGGGPPAQARREAIAAAFAEMERLIAIFDRRNAASALSALNSLGRLSSPPAELSRVLAAARGLGTRTGFAFNPAIAPLVDLFEASKNADGVLKVDDKDMAEALALSQPEGIRLEEREIVLERQGMRLTLDGIAKGYIADAASAVLSRHGAANHLVNAGGDIRAAGFAEGNRPWTVGVENPALTGGVVESVALRHSRAVATSGGYESFYDQSHRRHHLISHRTGQSPAIASVTVTAATAARADALATALALMPPAEAVRRAPAEGAECLILGLQGQRWLSPNWG